MKKVIFTLLISAAFTAAFAQTSKAIFTNGSTAEIGDFDLVNATFFNKQFVGSIQSTPHDFIYDAKNGYAIYQDKTNGLVLANITGKQITSKNINLMTTVMAPAYIPSSEEVVCFNVQKEFNGYGSNEDNLFLSKIDVKTGRTENLIEFNDLSFDNVSAPFYGKIEIHDRFGKVFGQKIEKEVAISKPLYIAEKELYIVMIRDVTGTNRLYKIRVNSKNANVSSMRCDYNIIDMAQVSGTDIAKALFFVKSGSGYELKIGDLNLNTNAMTNISFVKTFKGLNKTMDNNTGLAITPIIENGSIKFNTDQSQLYISHFYGNKTDIYNVNLDNNQNNSTVSYPGYVQYDFGFNESAYKTLKYADVLNLYPNPSTGMVYFKNNTGLMPTSIKVYDNLGNLVRAIEVEEMTSQIAIDLSEMAVGIYHVKVDMPDTKDFIGKVAVTN